MIEHLQQISLWILPILIAVVFHEVAHGYAANWLGDPTAAQAGRLTLNPLAHVDPIGSVALPLLLLVTNSGFLFGWAKPVPVNFGALGKPKRDMIFVAAAGPATNLLIATIAALLYHTLHTMAGEDPGVMWSTVLQPIALMAKYCVLMNVFLGVFNLLPIPPLDGGRVLTGLLPLELARPFARIERYGFLILILLMSTHALGYVVGQPISWLLRALL